MRAQDWPERLADWVREAETAARFSWKRMNCGFLVSDCAVAMGLPDPAARFRSWSAARLRRLSVDGLIEAVPYAEIPVSRAGRGDWLAYDGTTGPALAVCLGKHAIGFHPETQQLTRVPTLAALRAFKVE